MSMGFRSGLRVSGYVYASSREALLAFSACRSVGVGANLRGDAYPEVVKPLPANGTPAPVLQTPELALWPGVRPQTTLHACFGELA
jgi:hypothetical protein